MKVTQKIEVTINDRTEEITVAQAKELLEQLRAILQEPKTIVIKERVIEKVRDHWLSYPSPGPVYIPTPIWWGERITCQTTMPTLNASYKAQATVITG